jgi:hypothetical protein
LALCTARSTSPARRAALDLGGEHARPADGRERHVAPHVAARGHRDDLHGEPRMPRAQRALDQARLREGERALTRAESQDVGHG